MLKERRLLKRLLVDSSQANSSKGNFFWKNKEKKGRFKAGDTTGTLVKYNGNKESSKEACKYYDVSL